MSHRILSIKFINLDIKKLHGNGVRTWGKINFINQEKSVISICYGGFSLIVHTHLIPCFDGQKGDIGQFIGDIDDGVLIVKSFRRINELDLGLFELALEKRNAFLAKLQPPTSS